MVIRARDLPVVLSTNGPEADVVVSSRCRLARNLEGLPFPERAEPSDLARVLRAVEGLFRASQVQREFTLARMDGLDALVQQVMIERYLISPRLIASPEQRAVGFSGNGTLSVMVNEEDHLRLQAIRAGLSLGTVWDAVSQFDDWLGESLRYAFRADFGFLTAHVANLGTGLRASAMLHLPALVLGGRLPDLLDAARAVEVAVRGLHGEGSQADGDLYQVSNQYALGVTEEQLVGRVEAVVRHLIGEEREARQSLAAEGSELADAAWRSYGILTHARLIGTGEALQHLSRIRLGHLMGLLTQVDPQAVAGLMVRVQRGSLQAEFGLARDSRERDEWRAKIIREALAPRGNPRPFV